MGKSWSLRKKIKFALLLLIFVVPVMVLSSIPELFLIILFSIIAGSFTWWAVGLITPFLTKLYLKLHTLVMGKTGISKKIALVKNRKFGSVRFWDLFYRSLQDSFFPTIIAFSLIGFILRNAGGVLNDQVFLILIFSPIIVSFMIPLRIVQDSKLYYLNKETKEVISLGREINIRLKSIGGIMALGLFIFTLYTVTQDIRGVLTNLLIFFSFIYPTITITSFIYYKRWHPSFTGKTTKVGLDEGKQKYLISLLKR